MISSRKEYEDTMRRMILRVQQHGNTDFDSLSAEEAEILADCIKAGFVIGEATNWDENRHNTVDMRDLSGKATPLVISNIIPLKGLIFLENKPDWKFLLPTIISILALIVSIFRC